MKKLLVGTLLSGTLLAGSIPIIPQVGPVYVSIFKNADGSYVTQEITESLYAKMGEVDGYKLNPTLPGATLVSTARIHPDVGTTTINIQAWDDGIPVKVKDAHGKLNRPTIEDKNVVQVSLGSIALRNLRDFVSTKQAHAAIALDSSAKGARINATSITYSCTFTGSNLIAIMEVGENNPVNENITSATINGSAATKIDRSQLPSGGQGNMAIFYKFAPTTGNCVGSISGGVNHIMDAMHVSYTDSIQTGTWNISATSLLAAYQNATTSSNTNSFTQSTTVCNSTSWLVWFIQNDAGTPVAGTGFTIRQSDAAGAAAIGDSNGTVTGTASQTTTFASAVNWEGIQVSIAPTGASCGGGVAPYTDTTTFFQVL